MSNDDHIAQERNRLLEEKEQINAELLEPCRAG